jgi:hypothetical protein
VQQRTQAQIDLHRRQREDLRVLAILEPDTGQLDPLQVRHAHVVDEQLPLQAAADGGEHAIADEASHRLEAQRHDCAEHDSYQREREPDRDPFGDAQRFVHQNASPIVRWIADGQTWSGTGESGFPPITAKLGIRQPASSRNAPRIEL